MIKNMVLVGLTGSIGAGKSTVTELLRSRKFSVFDADACVHTLYEEDAVDLVEQSFPGSRVDGKINRGALLKILGENKGGFDELESIIHPLVDQKKREFLKHCQSEHKSVCFFDIPLLFETGQENMFDLTVVISVTSEIQQKRVLSRKGMTQKKLDIVLQRQFSSEKKTKLADHIIQNNGTIKQLEAELEKLLVVLENISGKAIMKWDL